MTKDQIKALFETTTKREAILAIEDHLSAKLNKWRNENEDDLAIQCYTDSFDGDFVQDAAIVTAAEALWGEDQNMDDFSTLCAELEEVRNGN